MKPILEGIFGFTGLLAGRVYATVDADGLTLIDSGMSRFAGRILGQLVRAGYAPHDVKRILITHAHLDHGGGAHRLQAATGAAVAVSALEAGAIRGTHEMPRARTARMSLLPRMMFSPTPVARELHEGDVIPESLGGLIAVATPGHTLGHLSFWSPSRGVLFTGDVVLHTLGIAYPLPALSFDMALQHQSVQKIAALEPDALLFGHGPPIVAGAAKRLHESVRRHS